MTNSSEQRASNLPPKAPRRPPGTALVAIASLAVLICSDFYAARFWLDHPVTTAILASLTVVLLSVTVIEVVLDRRSEHRWRLLAQYALLELAEAARAAWGVLLDVVEDGSSGSGGITDPSLVAQVLQSPERAPLLKSKIQAILTDPHNRDELRESLRRTLDTARELISRWGAVLTDSPSYSELFDRHVEMIGRIHGLWYFLAHGTRRGSQFRSPGGSHSDDWFVDNLLSMTRIAIRLEEETWAIALRVVPPEWWDRRTDELAAPAHAQHTAHGLTGTPPSSTEVTAPPLRGTPLVSEPNANDERSP